jgi:hypothetical protein
MDSAVISDELSSYLTNSVVKAALFTTYTFDPEFFELEVIPLLLPGNRAFSSDSRVKQFQVREALRESQISLDVFYDLPMYRREGSCSPSMEYQFHGVHRGNNAFHAKLALILVHDNDYGQDCLMVAAGSNNLSRSGWWSNIECLHWEMVWPKTSSRRFLDQLIADVNWLRDERRLDSTRQVSALDQIATYLQTCTGAADAADVSYYGLTDVTRQGSFQGFLRRESQRRWDYDNLTLEIISPFFANDVNNVEHEFFFKLGVRNIHLLLPQDNDENALCHQRYFDHINEQDGIAWAKWADGTSTQLKLKGQVFRPLHAKVYHFYNGKESWGFVGSVNFTHKAMRDNVEAGFLVKFDSPTPLLTPIRRPGSIEKFEVPMELLPGLAEDEEQKALPRIDLAYDWTEQLLTGITDSHMSYTVSILTPEGRAAVHDWPITGTQRAFEGDITELEKLLRNGSLVKVSGFNSRSGESFPAHTVMLMQTGWSHKPLELPDLTAAEILAIYASLTPEQRARSVDAHLIRKLILAGEAGDMTLPIDDLGADQFFSEYAEIFNAFRHLRKRLDIAQENDNQAIVDYYLTGTGMDSLPTLIDQVTAPENATSAVTAYLVVLCAREIYQDSAFRKRRRVKGLLAQLRKQIRALKSSDSIKLENNTAAGRRTFFDWFEKQFFRVYRVKEAEE